MKHPAMFPSMLVERVIQCWCGRQDRLVLDPFAGSGSTLVAAQRLGREGVGLDVYQEYVEAARGRLAVNPPVRLVRADAREIGRHVEPGSVDLCVTSPPYWDILRQRRTADYKTVRQYGGAAQDPGQDLATIGSYEAFLDQLETVFAGVHRVLRPGKYCVVNVMDLRKRDRFYPLHADLARRLETAGFTLDDIVIWDRRQDYNNLRPLGYPAVFRINKIHEFLLIFQKRVSTPSRSRSGKRRLLIG